MPPLSSTAEPSPPPSGVRWLWDTPWVWLALVVFLFCVPLFIGLDRTDLDNDEAIYSFAVEAMLKDGDWLTPKSIPSETSAFLEKPPLKFWITALPMRLGLLPPGEFGLRFMDAAMSALAFVYVFLIGRKLAGPVCGFVAVLLLFSHDALIYQHGLRSNNMESSTVLAYAAGVYHFLAWRSINPDVKRHIYAMSLWFVLGFMTKFVAALFLPVVLGLAALIKREDRGRLYRDWKTFALAGLLAIALIAPWFIYQYFERGPRVIDIMFGAHVFKRFTAYLDPDHLHPWHYYLTQLWSELEVAGTRTLIAVAAFLFVLRMWVRRSVEGAVIVLWFLIPMAAISTGTSKLYHYAFPFLAPVALVGGWLAAIVAARLFAWTAAPFDSFARSRDSLLPRWLTSARVQLGLTAIGLVSITVAAITAAYDRIHLSFGQITVRNSGIVRPLMVAAATWLVAAPPQVLRAALIGGLMMLALPLSAYHANVGRAKLPHRVVLHARECLTPLFAEQTALGRKPRGTLVEASDLSFIPFYYLRGFGPFEPGAGDSDATILKHVLSPDEPRLVLLSQARYQDIVTRLATNRSAIVQQAADLAGADPAVMQARLDQNQIGLIPIAGNVLLLPGPFAACGHERVRLINQ